MSVALEILLEKKQEKSDLMSALRGEIREINSAIKLLQGEDVDKTHSTVSEINPAIIKAVEQGCKTPATIHEYLESVCGVSTTKNSVNTRLSKMKSEGLLNNNGSGWTTPIKEKIPDVVASGINQFGGELVGDGIPKSDPVGSNPTTSTSYSAIPGMVGGIPLPYPELDEDIPF